MTLRLDSSEVEFTSQDWAPNGAVVLQIDKPEGAILEIQSRLDDAASFHDVEVVRNGRVFVCLRALPVLRLKIRKNDKREQVRVWSDR